MEKTHVLGWNTLIASLPVVQKFSLFSALHLSIWAVITTTNTVVATPWLPRSYWPARKLAELSYWIKYPCLSHADWLAGKSAALSYWPRMGLSHADWLISSWGELFYWQSTGSPRAAIGWNVKASKLSYWFSSMLCQRLPGLLPVLRSANRW